MLHECPKDANGIEAPYLISLGRIFITDYCNHAKKCSVLFKKTYAFRFPLMKFPLYFWLDSL